MPVLRDLLMLMKEKGASDLHITTGARPRLRIAGNLISATDYKEFSPEETKGLCCDFMTDAQLKKFGTSGEIDISFGIQGLSRFRANVFMQRGAVAGTFREIPFEVKTLRELGVPEIIYELLQKRHGLILVTGPAGSGKSTTLASMIEEINSGREAHIITIEDPIEFLHSHKKCIINQRELDSDTPSIASALNYVMRQDPDIVMIGTLRDLPAVEAALAIAESGHLVLASVHANSALQTIGRIVEFFPRQNHDYARNMLADSLEGIMSQRLVKKSDGGRALASEILVPTNAIRTLIREGKTGQIYPLMQTARGGMATMNQSLIGLCGAGIISYDDALANSYAPEEIMAKLPKTKDMAQRKEAAAED